MRGPSRALSVVATLALLAALGGCRKPGPRAQEDAGVGYGSLHVKAAASAPAAASAAARGKVGEVVAPTADDPRASFIDNRVAHAAAGVVEVVSLRVWKCGPSCTCPPPCIQAHAAGEPSRWLDVRAADGEAASLGDGDSADITGRFTGRTREAPSPEAGVAALLPELLLVGQPTVVATGPAPELEGARSRVVLGGPVAAKIVNSIKDERPFLVIAGAFPLGEASSDEAAGRLFEKVSAFGLADVERYDSRAFAGLACCFDLVIAGRFADAKAAAARQRLLVARGVKSAYVKSGF